MYNLLDNPIPYVNAIVPATSHKRQDSKESINLRSSQKIISSNVAKSKYVTSISNNRSITPNNFKVNNENFQPSDPYL